MVDLLPSQLPVCLADWQTEPLAVPRPQKANVLPYVILEGKLHSIVVVVIAVPEIHSSAILKLAARHHVFDWVVQQVRKRVISLVKIARRLSIGVPDVLHRASNRAAELFVPVVINKRNRAEKRKRNAFDRGYRIRKVILDADVDRCVVHVVLNAVAIDQTELAVVFSPNLRFELALMPQPNAEPLRFSFGVALLSTHAILRNMLAI